MASEAKGTGLAWALPLTPILVSVLVMGGACLLLTSEDGPRLPRVPQRLVVDLSDSEQANEEIASFSAQSSTSSSRVKTTLRAPRTSPNRFRDPDEPPRSNSVIPRLPGRFDPSRKSATTDDAEGGDDEAHSDNAEDQAQRIEAEDSLKRLSSKFPKLKNLPGFRKPERLRGEEGRQGDRTSEAADPGEPPPPSPPPSLSSQEPPPPSPTRTMGGAPGVH
jgi:hypothetical protein